MNPTNDPLQTGPPADLSTHLAPKEPGAPPADEHDTSGPPAPEVIRRGYEADVYDTKTVLSVPLLVILFFVLAFGTVTVIFAFIAYPSPDPSAHPGASERNKRTLKERIASTPSRGRPEPLKLRAEGSQAISRPPLPEGNSPEIHPEDLRVSREKFPTLFSTGWIDPGKKSGRVGLDATFGASQETLDALFPVQQSGSAPIASTNKPSAANAGRGGSEAPALSPKLPPEPAPAKKDEKKPPEAPMPKGGM